MLIWGDNKLALSALLEKYRGEVHLIYIDPPFDVGADFSVDVAFGGEEDELHKEQSVLEAVAYRDTWGKGTDSYLHMMTERLVLAKQLLAPTGSLYLHCDERVGPMLRVVLDELFGAARYVNSITWKRSDAHSDVGQGATHLGRICDTILYFTASQEGTTLNMQYQPLPQTTVDKWYRHVEEGTGRRYNKADITGPGGARKGNPVFNWKGVTRAWRFSEGRMRELDAEGRIVYSKSGMPYLKRYLDESKGVPLQDLWDDVKMLRGIHSGDENLGYATQKPEALLQRIIRTSSNEHDLVLDFFCGSGTTCAVAEKLGRRWIGVDLGRYAVHTTRKRLIQVQRELHAKNEPYRSFDVYNLGRYERQWWQLDRLKGADEEHRRIVLKFYKAAPLESPPNPMLHGTKNGALVHVDKIDGIFVFAEAQAVAQAAQAVGAREVHILAWEFEMELKRKLEALTAETGVKIRPFQIPREIMEPNRNEVQFFEAGALTAEIVQTEDAWDVRLTGFIPALAEAPEAELEMLRERAVNSPFDFIDFWAIDFDYNPDEPFEHHWQDFRTRKDRSLKTTSDAKWQYAEKGKRRICVKVIDVFGVDTTTILEVKP